MNGWENFLVAEISASAALTGLIFVAVSLSLAKILTIARLPDRAADALIVLITVLIISSLLLVPQQPLLLNGLELLFVGIVAWIMTSRLHYRRVRELEAKIRSRYRWTILLQIFLSQGATLPFVIAGILTLTLGSSGLYWIVPGVIFSFINAICQSPLLSEASYIWTPPQLCIPFKAYSFGFTVRCIRGH